MQAQTSDSLPGTNQPTKHMDADVGRSRSLYNGLEENRSKLLKLQVVQSQCTCGTSCRI